jgi:hypothetical protein
MTQFHIRDERELDDWIELIRFVIKKKLDKTSQIDIEFELKTHEQTMSSM